MNLESAREILIFHSRSKMNGHFPVKATHDFKLTNPICGDHVQIKAHVQDGDIVDIGFVTQACAICSAATAMMCLEVKGQSLDQARVLSQDFEDSLLAAPEETWPSHLKALQSFEHLKVNHARRACALLPWVALRSIAKEICQ